MRKHSVSVAKGSENEFRYGSRNWLLHARYVRGEHAMCLDLADELQKKTDNCHRFAHFVKGLVYADAGRHQDALERFHSALRLQPQDPEPLKQVAKSLSCQGRYQLALEAYLEADKLTKHPDSDIYCALADCAWHLGLLERGVEWARCGVQAGGGERAGALLARLLLAGGDVGGASAAYDSAIATHACGADTLAAAGALRLRAGDPRHAFQLLGAALAQQPAQHAAALALAAMMLQHRSSILPSRSLDIWLCLLRLRAGDPRHAFQLLGAALAQQPAQHAAALALAAMMLQHRSSILPSRSLDIWLCLLRLRAGDPRHAFQLLGAALAQQPAQHAAALALAAMMLQHRSSILPSRSLDIWLCLLRLRAGDPRHAFQLLGAALAQQPAQHAAALALAAMMLQHRSSILPSRSLDIWLCLLRLRAGDPRHAFQLLGAALAQQPAQHAAALALAAMMLQHRSSILPSRSLDIWLCLLRLRAGDPRHAFQLLGAALAQQPAQHAAALALAAMMLQHRSSILPSRSLDIWLCLLRLRAGDPRHAFQLLGAALAQQPAQHAAALALAAMMLQHRSSILPSRSLDIWLCLLRLRAGDPRHAFQLLGAALAQQPAQHAAALALAAMMLQHRSSILPSRSLDIWLCLLRLRAGDPRHAFQLLGAALAQQPAQHAAALALAAMMLQHRSSILPSRSLDIWLCLLRLRAGDPRHAFQLLGAALAQQPAQHAAALALAAMMLQHRSSILPSRSLDIWLCLLRLRAGDPRHAFQLLGAALAQQPAQHAAALALAAMMLQHRSSILPSRSLDIWLCLLRLRAGDPRHAFQLLGAALAQQPAQHAAALALAAMMLQHRSSILPSRSLDIWLCLLRLRAGDPRHAFQLLGAALAQQPAQHAAALALAAMMLQHRSSILPSRSLDIWLCLLRLRAGDPRHAFQLLGAALAQQLAQHAAALALAAMMLQHRDLDAALARLKAALSAHPTCVAAHANLGLALLAKKKYVAALTCLQRAAWSAPLSARAAHDLGLALLLCRRPASAFCRLAAAAALQPHQPYTVLLIGIALERLGDARADAAYARAAALAPDDALVRLNYAGRLARSGSNRQALEEARATAELLQRDEKPDAHLTSSLATLLALLRDAGLTNLPDPVPSDTPADDPDEDMTPDEV